MGGNIIKICKNRVVTAERISCNAHNGDIVLNASKSVNFSSKENLIYDSYSGQEEKETQQLLVKKVTGPEEVELGKTYTFKAVRFSREITDPKELENVKWAYQLDDEGIKDFPNKGIVVGNTVIKKIKITEENYDKNKVTIYAYIQSPSNNVSVISKLNTAYLKFDGRFLLFRVLIAGEIKRFTYKAISGRSENGSFDYSIERQKMERIGPIPEGEYYINPKAVQITAERGVFDELKGVVGRGTFPGGDSSWGYGRVWIKPDPVVIEGVTRGGFTIHGGDVPGSAGCIDLVGNDQAFFNVLKEYGISFNKIFLKVDYSSVREIPVVY